MSIIELQAELTRLEARATEIRSEGGCLIGVRLERSPSGGNASKRAKAESKYARLRIGKGGTLPNGRKSQYVALADIDKYAASIARGRELATIQKQMARLQAQLDQLAAQARSLGLVK